MRWAGMTEDARKDKSRSWWAVCGAAVGVLAVIWVLWRIDFERLRQVIVQAEIGFILFVPFAIAAEQVVRG